MSAQAIIKRPAGTEEGEKKDGRSRDTAFEVSFERGARLRGKGTEEVAWW